MMRIANIVTGFLKTLSGLIVFVSAASWAGALPSARFGGNELEAVTSVNDYVYYELNLGTDVFDCNGTIPVTMPVLSRDAAPANYQQPLIVIKAKKASISEGCSFKAPANVKLADMLTSDSNTSNCVVKSFVLTKISGTCGKRRFRIDVRGEGTCSISSDLIYYIRSNNGYDVGKTTYNFDINNGIYSLPSIEANPGNNRNYDWFLQALGVRVGGVLRYFGGKELYDGVSLDVTKVGSESGEKTAGKEAFYRVRVMDGGQECTNVLPVVKAGLLRSKDNEKSDVSAQVNGEEIGFVSSSGDEPPTEIKLDSVGSGSEKGAGFGFDYRDFGQSTLYVSVAPGYNVPGATHKSGDGSLPLVLRGSVETTSFPQGICLKYSEDNSRKLCSGGCELIRSGEEFLLDILPVAYSGRDDDPLDCSDANVPYIPVVRSSQPTTSIL